MLKRTGILSDCSGFSFYYYFYSFYLERRHVKKNTCKESNLSSCGLWLLRPQAIFHTAFPKGLRFVTLTFQLLQPFWNPLPELIALIHRRPAWPQHARPETYLCSHCGSTPPCFHCVLHSFFSTTAVNHIIPTQRPVAFWPFQCKCQSFAECPLRFRLPLLF